MKPWAWWKDPNDQICLFVVDDFAFEVYAFGYQHPVAHTPIPMHLNGVRIGVEAAEPEGDGVVTLVLSGADLILQYRPAEDFLDRLTIVEEISWKAN